MDVISGLSQAVSIAARLREIGKNIENAEFKNLLADLSLELADSKIKIADLVSENVDLKAELEALKSPNGEICPSCNNRTFALVSSEKMKGGMGALGVLERLYKCTICDFSESKTVTP